jgi:ATP-binding cassette subfamily B protein
LIARPDPGGIEITTDFASLLWPANRLGQAMKSLATYSKTSAVPTSEVGPCCDPPERISHDPEALADWLESAALTLGIEAQPVESSYPEFEKQLRHMGPALLHVPSAEGPTFLAILGNSTFLRPDLREVRFTPSDVRSELCGAIERPIVAEIREMLDRSGVPRSKQARARQTILRERLRAFLIRGIWILRLPPGASFWLQLRQARIPERIFALGTAHALQYILWIVAWWIVGSNVLRGRTDHGWLVLWALLLLTMVPLRVLNTWLQGLITIRVGARLKHRLFFGALRLEPDRIRHQGAGELLGRVLESQAVEALALSGGFLSLVALIEIFIAGFVLAAGAGGLLHSLLLFVWLLGAAGLAWRYFQRNRAWTDVRLAMTHDLIANMVGHRTRLAQLPADRWHDDEDEGLEQYLTASQTMDHSTASLIAFVPRGWLVLGLVGLIPAVVEHTNSPARFAIAVGGILLAYRAWRRFGTGAWQLVGAVIAWQHTSILYHAAARADVPGSSDAASSKQSFSSIEASNIVFRYSDRSEPVLRGCSFRIMKGERLVLKGASGGGKSTLVSLLTGLRQPHSGQLSINGLDRETLGSVAWSRRVAAAPQFHENHVLAGTFAFNLFLGRPKALGPSDFEEAQAICHELGLGDLLERMPAGMLQMVGETGWQLSHGERSRLYIARALLQGADLVVLDESFAVLDPENMKRAIECAVKRSATLLVITH